MIYNNLEIRIRDLISELTGPTVTRQQECTKHINKLFQTCHAFDSKLRDCQLGIKK